MDDSDDENILEDIENLHNLMNEGADSSDSDDDDDDGDDINNDADVTSFKVFTDDFEEKLPGFIQESSPNSPESPTSVELADILDANRKLIEAYKVAEAALEKKLEDCRKKRAEATYQLELIDRGGKANWKIPYVRAGMPYFKDSKLFPAPLNQDTIQKKKMDELAFVYTCRPRIWTTRSRNILNREVREQAAERVLTKMKRMAEISKKTKNKIDTLVPKDWKRYGKAGPSEYDWMKISTKDLKSKYSWTVCWAMWNLLLNDDINRGQWTEDEDNRLLEIAENHKYQDWDSIAESLDTRRSGYQCFVRHGSLSRPTAIRPTDTAWTQVQDRILFKCVKHLRLGSWIPWGIVTSYIEDRTKNQVYSHWKYNLDPSLKKGRFSAEEDEIIMDGVRKYGKNFPKIAAMLLPDRTSVQVSGRHKSLMLRANGDANTWTIAEDQQLLALHEELGPQWKCIADILKKDRTYVRHRYTALKRDLKKGMKLVSIKRKSADPLTSSDSPEDPNVNVENNVDIQLIRYFQCIKPMLLKPGRKAKYHTADQLETKTRMLADAFKKLQVNFTIPDNLDDYNLTEKDKQLLITVKNYTTLPRTSAEELEEYRKKMFVTNRPVKNETEEFFSPSASFSFVRARGRKREREKIAINPNINLPEDPVNFNNINLKVKMEFETPKNISEILRDDEKTSFEKLMKCVSVKTTSPKYIPTCDKKIGSAAKFAARPSCLENSDGEDEANENLPFIEPSCSTLLAYKCLLHMKDNMKFGDDPDPPEFLTSTPAARQAFDLLKTRFSQVFKYPIGLARTRPTTDNITSHSHSVSNHDENPENE